MAATLPDIELTTQWQDIHLLSGAAAGSEVGFQNKSLTAQAVIQRQPTEPAEGDDDGVSVAQFPNIGSFVLIEADAVNKTWARLINGTGKASVIP